LNRFYNGNIYGHFFVQYEAKVPVYSFRKNLWRTVNPAVYFQKSLDGSLGQKVGAIYDIIITQPISIKSATIQGVKHPRCIPRKCNGVSLRESGLLIKKVARK
jgi:hypothetical protein